MWFEYEFLTCTRPPLGLPTWWIPQATSDHSTQAQSQRQLSEWEDQVCYHRLTWCNENPDHAEVCQETSGPEIVNTMETLKYNKKHKEVWQQKRRFILTWNLSSNSLIRCLLKVCSRSSERLASWLDWDTSCVMKRAAASISSFIVSIESFRFSTQKNRFNKTQRETGNSRVCWVQCEWLKVFQQLGYYEILLFQYEALVFTHRQRERPEWIYKCVTKVCDSILTNYLKSTLLNSHNVLPSDAGKRMSTNARVAPSSERRRRSPHDGACCLITFEWMLDYLPCRFKAVNAESIIK